MSTSADDCSGSCIRGVHNNGKGWVMLFTTAAVASFQIPIVPIDRCRMSWSRSNTEYQKLASKPQRAVPSILNTHILHTSRIRYQWRRKASTIFSGTHRRSSLKRRLSCWDGHRSSTIRNSSGLILAGENGVLWSRGSREWRPFSDYYYHCHPQQCAAKTFPFIPRRKRIKGKQKQKGWWYIYMMVYIYIYHV